MKIYEEKDASCVAFWGGACDNFEILQNKGLLNEFDLLCEEIFEGEASETQINDFLWFEWDYICECLGIEEKSEDYEDDDEEIDLYELLEE